MSTESTPSPHRPIRPGPRILEHFRETEKCVICQTNDDGPAVLVPIDGTDDGEHMQAEYVHLACCIPDHYHRGERIFYKLME